MPLLCPKFSSKGIHNFGHAKIECEIDNTSRWYFDNDINKKNLLHPCQISQILGVKKNSKDECITSAGKEGQNYFTMSSYFKTKITFCKGVDKGVRSSLFHSHSSVSSSSSVLSNSKIKIAELASTKKFDSMIVLTEEARKELQWWVKTYTYPKGKSW